MSISHHSINNVMHANGMISLKNIFALKEDILGVRKYCKK